MSAEVFAVWFRDGHMKKGTLDVQRNHKVVWFQDIRKALQGLVACGWLTVCCLVVRERHSAPNAFCHGAELTLLRDRYCWPPVARSA